MTIRYTTLPDGTRVTSYANYLTPTQETTRVHLISDLRDEATRQAENKRLWELLVDAAGWVDYLVQ